MRTSDLGEGPKCPEDATHGKLYGMGDHLWCPVSQAIFDAAVYDEVARGFVAGALVRDGYIHTVPED